MNTPKQLLGEGLLHNVPGTEVFDDSDHLIKSKDSNIELGAIQVTLDVGGAPVTNLSGQGFRNTAFRLWDKTKGVTANFSTTFVLNISPETSPGGEGLSFILAADTTPPQTATNNGLECKRKHEWILSANVVKRFTSKSTPKTLHENSFTGLTGEAPPPHMPTEIPAFVWPAMPPSFKGDSGN
nr:putative l-type lectin-domain containing receptor kinase s.5 [Quercus suber]